MIRGTEPEMLDRILGILGRILGYVLRFLESFMIPILKQAPIPSHVAFIMDGNRRFAKKVGLPAPIHGHEHGFQPAAFERRLIESEGLATSTRVARPALHRVASHLTQPHAARLSRKVPIKATPVWNLAGSSVRR